MEEGRSDVHIGYDFMIRKLVISILLFAVLAPGQLFGANSSYEKLSAQALQQAVADLHLGLGIYRIGTILSPSQVEKAQARLEKGNYPGTYKFRDGDVYVVASEKANVVLAVYLRNEEAGIPEVRNMVSELMLQFGEPTTTAHDKIIYWAYNEDGKIEQELFDLAKSNGKLSILATVKFNSTLEMFGAGSESGQESKEEVQPGVIYAMVTSEPYLKKFLETGGRE